jgi:hypothetical protein
MQPSPEQQQQFLNTQHIRTFLTVAQNIPEYNEKFRTLASILTQAAGKAHAIINDFLLPSKIQWFC